MIELRALSKRFGDTVAVREVSLTVQPGELLVLVGGSGSGKTTTLRMINRLIEPTSGELRLFGEDARALPAAELRRKIGYVFQGIGLFPHLSVAENVAVTPKLLGHPPAQRRSRADELLALVGLDPSIYRHRRPAELSGGQQQRVGVARALAAEPELMLLDEPFGALDPHTRERLQEHFRTLQKDLGITAVFVTHDMLEAFLLADQIGVMRSGELVQMAPPSTLLDNPVDEEVRDLVQAPLRQLERIEALSAARGSA